MSSSQKQPQPQHRSGFIAVIGPANAGKSSLINAIIGEKVSIVSHRAHTTRTRVSGILNLAHAQLIFVDTPGFISRRKSGMEQALDVALSEAVQGVDAVLVVVDATRILKDARALDAVRAELAEKIVEQIDFVVINKIDLLKREEIFQAITLVSTTLCGENFKGEIIPTSALKGEGLDAVVRCVEKLLPEGPQFFEPGTTSDQSEKQLVTEVIREKIFRLLRDEIPYSSAVIIDGWEESPERLSIHASIIVERDSQKPIVVGKGGAMIKEIGIAARRELETILKTAIMLKLFVRVEKDWSLTARGVEKFGLPS